jgi:hypothetical protein
MNIYIRISKLGLSIIDPTRLVNLTQPIRHNLKINESSMDLILFIQPDPIRHNPKINGLGWLEPDTTRLIIFFELIL